MIRREFPDIPRRVSGYNLPALLPENGFNVARALVGSESTLALVLEADVHLMAARPHRTLVVLGFADVFAAADHVPDVMSYRPVAVEGLDRGLIEDLRSTGLPTDRVRLLPEGRGWLLVEFGGAAADDASAQAHEFVARMRGSSAGISVAVVADRCDQAHLWEIRESGLAGTAGVSGAHRTWPGWEDSAVPPERLGAYLRELDALVHRYGGSLSGKHGDGQARGELLQRMYSPETIQAFREFKAIWDPEGRMNPGKIVDASPLDAQLRLGPSYDPSPPRTWFAFPEDRGSFARATLRCVGVGKCRKVEAGTMCPSYMATRNEKHTTRGRARLLFEMLEGDPIDAGWRDEQVRNALDLCLACKGCKAECPVNVDMATYKAEFLAHYFAHRLRPPKAYAFGHIGTSTRVIARLGAQCVANDILSAPGLGALTERLAGVAPQRAIPAFARRTFRSWFVRHHPRSVESGPTVLLWPDTFNDHFYPQTLHAALDVLEALGFAVRIPRTPLCCGRPLYDYGMLSTAKRRLQTILTALDREIRDGTPIVGLEPSCVSVFRDELVNLFPSSDRARRLSGQMLTFGELLDRHGERLGALALDRRAIVHGHCHHKAVMHDEADRRVLDRIGLRYEVLDAGCCGMAGGFGFEADHYDVSMTIGERVLLPAVRAASADTLVLADGFSCREQIAQGTGRRALHLAEVLRMAIPGDAGGRDGERPRAMGR